jgi:hypothetical protein
MKKIGICIYSVILLVSCAAVLAKDKKESELPACTVEQCSPKNKKNCQCYCAAKGDYREWLHDDEGYVPSEHGQEDTHGFGCYCQEWDFKNAPVASDEDAEQHIKELKERENKKPAKKMPKKNGTAKVKKYKKVVSY